MPPFSTYSNDTALGVTIEVPTKAPSGLVPVIRMLISGPEDTALAIHLAGGESIETKIQGTGSYADYQTRKLGEIEIPDAGEHQLGLRGVNEVWQPIDVRSAKLIPVK